MNKEYIRLMKSRTPKLILNYKDFLILMSCSNKEYSLTELKKELGIAHKNLIPHIKKLSKWGFIKIKDLGKGKKKLIRTNIEDNRISGFLRFLIEKQNFKR